MRAFILNDRFPALLFAATLLGSVFSLGFWFDRIADEHEALHIAMRQAGKSQPPLPGPRDCSRSCAR